MDGTETQRADGRRKYLEQTKKLTLDFMRGEPAKIYLFGSWARGEERHGSDIDLAVAYEGKSNRLKVGELAEMLEESTVPYNVDVVDLAYADEAIRRAVEREGILWQSPTSD